MWMNFCDKYILIRLIIREIIEALKLRLQLL